MPADRLERVEAWGMNRAVLSYVYRPSTVDAVREVFSVARDHGLAVGLRGAGCSYGDASLVSENICLDLTRMDRILQWDPSTGVIEVEPGVTLKQLWQHVVGDGWWPPVVSGTMFVTMGGAAGMNFHGKNNFVMGPLGDHILEFDLLLPSGEILVCSRDRNQDLFFAAIGGFGMLGCVTRIAIKMKKVYSGLLSVTAFSTRNFGHIIEEFETRRHNADYLVGWIDCFAAGDKLGRGLVHEARYLHEGEDPYPEQTLRVKNQELPDTLMGVLPKSVMWRLIKPFSNDLGMKLINFAKYTQGSTLGNNKVERQSHAGFAFLLDYVPNWKWAYKPGGFIQYQSFIPAETAEQCFSEQIRMCHAARITPYLGVLKRHRKDAFLMTHSVDGYSLALDFPVTERNQERLWDLAAKMNEVVVRSGGRFYFAKDSTLDSRSAHAYLGEEAIDRFFALKRRCDPENLLQTDLARRLFGDRICGSNAMSSGASG
jgi:FAD/FMN-containing dehydrogenase